MLVRTMHHYRERRDNSKGVNHFSIQRIVFPTGAKMLILATDAVSKFNTGRLPWQPAGNKKNKHHIFASTAGAHCAIFP